MIFGAGFPVSAEAELAVRVPPAPEAACSRSSRHPVSTRNRTNQVTESDSMNPDLRELHQSGAKNAVWKCGQGVGEALKI